MKIIKIVILFLSFFHLNLGGQVVMHFCAGSLCEVYLDVETTKDDCCDDEEDKDEDGCCQNLVISHAQTIPYLSDNSNKVEQLSKQNLAQAEIIHFCVSPEIYLEDPQKVNKIWEQPPNDFKRQFLVQRKQLYNS